MCMERILYVDMGPKTRPCCNNIMHCIVSPDMDTPYVHHNGKEKQIFVFVGLNQNACGHEFSET